MTDHICSISVDTFLNMSIYIDQMSGIKKCLISFELEEGFMKTQVFSLISFPVIPCP